MRDRRGVGRTEVIVGVAVVALLLLVTVPLWLSTSRKSARAEVPLLVNAIRTAEITYEKAFDDYVSAEAAPRPLTAVDDQKVPWRSTPGFDRLAWQPDATEVWGAYQVVAREDGFTVTGTCDIDGDGSRATFIATEAEPATMRTDPSVF